MRLTTHGQPGRHFGSLLIALMLSVGITLSVPPPTLAQSLDNQTFTCGAYGAGAFGRNDCVATTERTSTPTPTLAPSGLFPGTGAGLGLWAAIGALILAIGLGLYGYHRRRAPRAS